MCDAQDIDGPEFPVDIESIPQPGNAVEMINKLVMTVSFCLYFFEILDDLIHLVLS